jgi:hypothetical protein
MRWVRCTYDINYEVDGWPYSLSVLMNDGVLLYSYDVRFLILRFGYIRFSYIWARHCVSSLLCIRIRQIIWVLITCMCPNCWVSWFWNWFGGADIFWSVGDPDASWYTHFYTTENFRTLFHSVKLSAACLTQMEHAHHHPLRGDNDFHFKSN